MEQEVDHLRRTNTDNQRSDALANLPDKFRNIDTTRKTCIEEAEEEGTNPDEDEWVEEFKRQEELQEDEYNNIEENAEYIETNAECETEFKEFLDNIGRTPKDIPEIIESTICLNL